MLVLKNVKSDESIGVLKSVFTLGYDILQRRLNNHLMDCDESFDFCVLYYNEFYHSVYNDNNVSEYDSIVAYFTEDSIDFEEWMIRIQLIYKICSYYGYSLAFDCESMKISLCDKLRIYNYNTMAEFALGWLTRCEETASNTNNKVFTNKDLNRLREMGGLLTSKTRTTIEEDSYNFEFFVTDKEIEKGLYIDRYVILNDDDLHEAIDDYEMDIHDYLIATFKSSPNISYNIFTTHNLYNVYIDKIIHYQDGSCDTVDMNNITLDSLEWNNKNDIIKYFLGMN